LFVVFQLQICGPLGELTGRHFVEEPPDGQVEEFGERESKSALAF
jgi:hypothetical protein